MFLSSESGAVTSRDKVTAPAALRSLRREASRAVAMTWCPRFRASSAIYLPKPDEEPVMSHTGGLLDIVRVRWSDNKTK